uniref:C3H1-type domain-containing protein n=1 Tax=Quercus lobata TaxID=97700 RepID=A0A7N2MKI2_QUELO
MCSQRQGPSSETFPIMNFFFFEIQEQNICSHYSLYGICKFGLACKFDHPIDPPSSPMTGVDQHSSYGISVTTENAGVAGSGSGSGSDATLQQPE